MTPFQYMDRMLVNMNQSYFYPTKRFEYQMQHVLLVREYAFILNDRLNYHLDRTKLSFAALSHDLLKESRYEEAPSYLGFTKPIDPRVYTRSNMYVVDALGLGDYFNTSIQYHALGAAIFLKKEIGILSDSILYPVAFHSCPIMPVYETLSVQTRQMIDIIMLSDKLSSNYLNIHMRERKVPIDLDEFVFGASGTQLRYEEGLYLARIIGNGNSSEEYGVQSVDYYHERARKQNPLIGTKRMTIKDLGGNQKWPKRKSMVLKMPLHPFKTS